ncbi:unnamed protein product [Moneuplotes crassus]|uniref:Uncharacterized protein n=1 Tax=Euplotes crassus TaxID=5936 RepID=A0AAD1YA72_EUPCR|nr:unnamed protein product [Moneuplotes crassus]
MSSINYRNSTCFEDGVGHLLNFENFKNAVCRRKMRVSRLNNVSTKVVGILPIDQPCYKTCINPRNSLRNSDAKPLQGKKAPTYRKSMGVNALRDKIDRYYINNKSLAFEDCMNFSEDEEVDLDPPTKRWNLIQKFICSKNVPDFSGQIEEISRHIHDPASSHGKRRRYKCKKSKAHANASLNIPFQNQAQRSFMIPCSNNFKKDIHCKIFAPVRKGSTAAHVEDDQRETSSLPDIETVSEPEHCTSSIDDKEITQKNSLKEEGQETEQKPKQKKSRPYILCGSFCRRVKRRKFFKQRVESSRNSSFIMPDIHSLGPVKLNSSQYSQSSELGNPKGFNNRAIREEFAKKKFASCIDEGSINEPTTDEEASTPKSKGKYLNQSSKIWSSSTNEDQTNVSDGSEKNILFKNSVKLPNLTPIPKVLKKTYINEHFVLLEKAKKKRKHPKVKIGKNNLKRSKNIYNISMCPKKQLEKRSASLVPQM